MNLIFCHPCKGFRILESGKFHLWNPKSWALESGIYLKESGIPQTIGIQNPSSTDKNWNLKQVSAY